MKLHFPNHLTGLLMLSNIVFWIVFGVAFAMQSYPYERHKLTFEEITPSYIFFGRALREVDSGTGAALPPLLMKVTNIIQRPSFIAAVPYFWFFNSHGITVDHPYWRISVGGYYLLLVCLISFLQWYLVGTFFNYVWRRLMVRPRPVARASVKPL
jgi:hypothetical protein